MTFFFAGYASYAKFSQSFIGGEGMALYSEEWFYPTGQLATNQRAIVFGPGDDNAVAPIFSDAGLTIPLANPTVTDANGMLTFHAPDGTYWIWVGPTTGGNGIEINLGADPGNPVLTVNSVVPDGGGNVELTAADLDAQPITTIDATGDLYIGTGPNATTRLPIGSAGEVLTVVAGTASWEPGGSGAVDSVNGQTGVVVLTAADVGADPAGSAAAAAAASQPLATINAKGDLYAGTANDTTTRQPVGADGQVLTANSAQATGLEWTTPASAGIPATILDAKGDIIAATAADTASRLAVGADGQVLRANAAMATGLEWDTLNAADVGALDLTGGTITGDVLFSGPNTDLTVQGATTVTYQGLTANVGEALAAVMSTTVISGGVVTVASPTTVDITAVVGFIMDSYTTPTNPVLTRISVGAQVGVAMTAATLARQVTAFVIDSTGTLLQIPPPTFPEDRQYLVLGNIVQIGAGIFVSDPLQFRLTQPAQQTLDFMRAVGPFVASGNILSGIGGGLTFQRTAGQLFAAGSNTGVDRADPNVVTTVLANPQSMRYATQIAGSAEAVAHTNVYPGDYDVGGVITAIPGAGTRATIQRMWYFTAGGGGVIVQYGQEYYTTLDEAVLNMNTQSFIENPNLQYATLLGSMAITKGATDLGDPTQAKFFSAVKLGGSFVGSTLGVTVISVNGFTGNVVLTSSDVGAIPEALVDAKGDIVTATADDTPARLPVGTDGQALRANSATSTGLEWDTLTASDVGAIANTLVDAKGDLITASAADTPARLPVGTDGQVLSANSAQATGLEWVAAGGGGIPATIFDAKGDLIAASAADTAARLAVGANGLVLSADSAQSTGLKWALAKTVGMYPRSTGFIPTGGVVTARSSKAATLNAMFLIPFVTLVDATLSVITWEVTGNVATAVVRLGIYGIDSAGLPTGAAVADYGTTAADTTGVKTAAVSTALAAGLWYLAFVGQTAAPTVRHCAGFSPFVASTSFPSGTGLGWNNAWVQTGVSGTLPTIGSITDTDSPLCGVKF